MLVLSGSVLNRDIGNHIFYSKQADRYILANNATQANGILGILGFLVSDSVQCATLDSSSVCKHSCGERVTITHRGKIYPCDTILAYGSPKGLDTTKSLSIFYRRD